MVDSVARCPAAKIQSSGSGGSGCRPRRHLEALLKPWRSTVGPWTQSTATCCCFCFHDLLGSSARLFMLSSIRRLSWTAYVATCYFSLPCVAVMDALDAPSLLCRNPYLQQCHLSAVTSHRARVSTVVMSISLSRIFLQKRHQFSPAVLNWCLSIQLGAVPTSCTVHEASSAVRA